MRIYNKRIQELKKLKNKIESVLNMNQYFKKLYESNNVKDETDTEKYIYIVDEENRNTFSDVSDDIKKYFDSTGDFNMGVFNPTAEFISEIIISDMHEAINNLMTIFEFQGLFHDRIFGRTNQRPSLNQ